VAELDAAGQLDDRFMRASAGLRADRVLFTAFSPLDLPSQCQLITCDMV